MISISLRPSFREPRLNLVAGGLPELVRVLRGIDITVPLQGEGRTRGHVEQYPMARLLASLALAGDLRYPLEVKHRDRPDFELFHGDRAIGVECVTAIHREWAEIQAIREADYPDALIFVPRFRPGEATLSRAELLEVASGAHSPVPWDGKSAVRHWAAAHESVISDKLGKLRRGSYKGFSENWLLVQDEWPVPIYGLRERVEAAGLCAAAIAASTDGPVFDRVYICNSLWCISLVAGQAQVVAIPDLWAG